MKVILVLVLTIVCVYGKVTPDYFPSCKRSDPEIVKCILDAVEVMRPYLIEGIPDLHIPALEPFSVPTLKLDRTAPNMRIKATIKHGKATGGGAFKVDKLKLDLNDKYAGEIKITIPKLNVIANYDIKGSQILTLDISGKGRMNGNFSGITVIAKGAAKPITKDGEEFLQVDKVVSKVRVKTAHVAFADTERPAAADAAASFFNASPQVVLDIINPLIEETASAVIKAFFNKILGSIPIKEVLKDKK